MSARIVLVTALALCFSGLVGCASTEDRKAKEGLTGPGVVVDPQSGAQPELFRFKQSF